MSSSRIMLSQKTLRELIKARQLYEAVEATIAEVSSTEL